MVDCHSATISRISLWVLSLCLKAPTMAVKRLMIAYRGTITNIKSQYNSERSRCPEVMHIKRIPIMVKPNCMESQPYFTPYLTRLGDLATILYTITNLSARMETKQMIQYHTIGSPMVCLSQFTHSGRSPYGPSTTSATRPNEKYMNISTQPAIHSQRLR